MFLRDYKHVLVGISSEVIITSSITLTMTGTDSSLSGLAVAFIAVAAVVAVLLVTSVIVIGVVIYRHKRFKKTRSRPGPRYVLLLLTL